MGKRIVCYHPGCNNPPTVQVRVGPRLAVGYCAFHARAALQRKREADITAKILRGEKT